MTTISPVSTGQVSVHFYYPVSLFAPVYQLIPSIGCAACGVPHGHSWASWLHLSAKRFSKAYNWPILPLVQSLKQSLPLLCWSLPLSFSHRHTRLGFSCQPKNVSHEKQRQLRVLHLNVLSCSFV